MPNSAMLLHAQDDYIVIDNGVLQITLTNPGGNLTRIQYSGINNVLETQNTDLNGGFWDLNWSEAGSQKTRGKFDTITGTSFKIIVENEKQMELSFTRTWDPSDQGEHAPLYIDKRFVILRGVSGFYSYAIYKHLKVMPAFNLNTSRIAFMLSKDKFHYMAVADNRQRYMPHPDDRLPGRGEQLAYPEAVRLVDPIEPEFKGEVDDKYQYSIENKDNRVHGWICFDPPVGFWQITPSNEFRNGGPLKQDLSSHVNPSTLAIFLTSHYGGQDLLVKFGAGEEWTKVLGPVFIYLNSVPNAANALYLWEDAKEQMIKETNCWPYSFLASDDFPNSDCRGTMRGRLLVYDRFITEFNVPAALAYVGLAAPGDAGSWQRESKGYQFWTKANECGEFTIMNIRAGNYNLFAWVPGFIGDYRCDVEICISSGCDVDVGDLVYEPPRDGPTMWEIGIPDRSAAEFYIPDPNPMYINKLYVNHPDRFRQYGLWERYADLYPDKDLVYTISVSDYTKDWFFAQVNRKIGDGTYKTSTWQIKFEVLNVERFENYKLRLALAAAHHSDLQISDDQVVMYNGLLQLTFTKPGGHIIGLQYNELDNLLELHNPELNGGFWDLNWSDPESTQTRGKFDMINGTIFEIIVQNEEQVELSFKRPWDSSLKDEYSPLYIDKRFIMLSGSSGFYSYAIYEHRADMPPFSLNEARLVFMLNIEKFRYMAMADNRQRYMPLPYDRLPGRGQELAYPEAVLLVNPVEPEFTGEVDDKYQYMCENKDNKVHGWICLDPPIGFWQITPSNEFKTCGPLKQDLTSHVGPVTLAMFVSAHYGGVDVVLNFKSGEPWKKVFGPVFIYLNTNSDKENAVSVLWENAKEQMRTEVQSWPYHFPLSEDFPQSDQRGSVSGTLLVNDSYVSDNPVLAVGAHIGLAAPGNVGSFQREGKGYQFWTNTNDEGHFFIENIRPGDYNLYAWVPGFIGDFQWEKLITVTPGGSIDAGTLTYKPPRDGPTLWEIGTPDRSAAEFFVPEPDPKYINKLYANHPDRFRQYGLWERYTDLYPDKDLVYTIGVSEYHKDWFYAQVTRKAGSDMYTGTTWQIKFKLGNVDHTGIYKLRLALASATMSILEVRVNDEAANPPIFSTGSIGKDNAIARHGIHGLYWLFNVDIHCTQLVEGENTIFLKQTNGSKFQFGVLYDYVRLEGSPLSQEY